MPNRSPLHLAVALDGAGWHPAARPRELFTARYRLDLVLEAERGLRPCDGAPVLRRDIPDPPWLAAPDVNGSTP
jgi:hypothetical protein